MTLQSSGQISLSQIQAEFGGTNPISMSEYRRSGGFVPALSANSNIPTSLSNIAMNDFYGAKKCYDAGGNTLYTHTSGYSSVGEGFFRVLEEYTAPLCGTYNVTGTYVVGSSYPSKCIDVELWKEDGGVQSKVADLYAICDGSFHTVSGTYNNNVSITYPLSKIILKGYVWGNFGSDRFESSSMTVKAY